MTNYKVGDKVRILDVDAIDGGDGLVPGGVYEVVALHKVGEKHIESAVVVISIPLPIVESELSAIELVEETPKLTKKARIEALEKASKEQANFNEATADDFADLFERVEALEKRLDEPTHGDAITSVNDVKLGDKIAIVGYLSEYLRANSSYEVVEISSENSNDGEKIVVPDDDGDEFVLRPEDFSKLRKVAS